MLKKLLTLLFSVLLFSACREASNFLHTTVGTKTHDYSASNLALKKCKIDDAMKIVQNNKNQLLKNLELGLGNYFKQHYVDSNNYFDMAINEYRKNENKALLDISTFLKKEYYLEGYDKVLLHNYKAINYLLIGDAQAARVEARNSNTIQQEEQKKLQKFKKENNKENLNSHLFSRYKKLFKNVNAKHNPYQNPFAYYTSALAYAEDDDYENALIDIRHALKFLPNSKILKQKLQCYEAKDNKKTIELFFDVGQAPIKSQVALKLNMGNGEKRMAYLPSFHLEISNVDHISILNSKGEEVAKTSLLADINAIKINEFKEKLPSILYLVSQQVAISLGSSELSGDSKIISGLFNSAAAIYGQNATGTWSFLPQKILVASFTPLISETYSMLVVSNKGETLTKKSLIWNENGKTKNIYRHYNLRDDNTICKDSILTL